MAKYEEGKVYLRDVRTGQIYLYERVLESNKNFETCIPNPVKAAKADDGDGKDPAKDDKKVDA